MRSRCREDGAARRSEEAGDEPRPYTRIVHCLVVASAIVVGALAAQPAMTAKPPVLRVCADPNNLPFTDAARRGFEDRIVDLVATDLGARVESTWWAQRRGFLRNTLRARQCDLVPGLPSSTDMALVTAPYYRSSYVFLQRADAPVQVRSFDDLALRRLRVGVQIIGNDYTNAPPAHALAARGIVDNVRGYLVYGDYRRAAPAAEIVAAVARGDVDVAVVWGPLAGYFAPRQGVPLVMRSVRPQIDMPFLPMAFDISMGVRRGGQRLRNRVDQALQRHRGEIERILAAYGVPRVEGGRVGS